MLGVPQRALRGLQERRQGGLQLPRELFDGDRPVADRDAVRAEDLPQCGLERVGTGLDEHLQLAIDGRRKRQHDQADDDEPGAITRDHDHESRTAGPLLRGVDEGREGIGDERRNNERDDHRLRQPEDDRDQGDQPDHPAGRYLEDRIDGPRLRH